VGRSGTPVQTGVLDLNTRLELMFLGQFYHNIDEKGRLTLPARFRELLAEDNGAYVMHGFDQNLMLLPSSMFGTIYERITKMSLTEPSARQLRRMIFSSAAQVDFDKNGRILIPQFLRDAANISGDAVIVGTGNYIEIWTPKLWTVQTDQLNNPEITSDRFAALDLSSG
jgi:transcriptional regulator MraZ